MTLRFRLVGDYNNNNNNRSFNMVKTHAQPYKHITHTNILYRTACLAGQQ